MYDFGRSYGESCYRLMSRTGQFIYLKTRGSLEVDDKTRQVHSFVCVNSLVSDEEGKRLIKEMKKKFSAIISEAELSAMESNIAALENPQKLESAILNLITNLNNQSSYDDDNVSMVSDSTEETDDTRRTKSPPLAIIAPKPNTIKNSISKAVAVIGHKCQSPSIKDEPKSPETPATPSSIIVEIKSEPSCNILSPTPSSVSSVDSEVSSPFLNQNTQLTASNSTSRQVQPKNNSTNDFFTPYDYLPTYDPSTAATASNDSIIATSNVNNNNSNNNRNSVLKRTHDSSDVDEYTELIKKRALSEHSNVEGPLEEAPIVTLDLLATSGSGTEFLLRKFIKTSFKDSRAWKKIFEASVKSFYDRSFLKALKSF